MGVNLRAPAEDLWNRDAFFSGHHKSGTKEYERVIGEYFKKKNPLIQQVNKQWVLICPNGF